MSATNQITLRRTHDNISHISLRHHTICCHILFTWLVHTIMLTIFQKLALSSSQFFCRKCIQNLDFLFCWNFSEMSAFTFTLTLDINIKGFFYVCVFVCLFCFFLAITSTLYQQLFQRHLDIMIMAGTPSLPIWYNTLT